MANLWVQETTLSHRDDGDCVLLGTSPVYETASTSTGELFRNLLGEYGRCTGRVFVDNSDGPPSPVGWVFQARRPFQDDPSLSSLIETWVTVHTGPSTLTVNYSHDSE